MWQHDKIKAAVIIPKLYAVILQQSNLSEINIQKNLRIKTTCKELDHILNPDLIVFMSLQPGGHCMDHCDTK